MDKPRAPADIAMEMARLLSSKPHLSSVDGDRYRGLGALLMQTPGSTALDALAFASIAGTLVNSIHTQDPEVENSRGTLDWVAGYLARTIEALEATTGYAGDFAVYTPPNPN